MKHTTETQSELNMESDSGQAHLNAGSSKLSSAAASVVIQLDTIDTESNPLEQEQEQEQEEKLTRSQRFKVFWSFMRPMVVMLVIDAAIPVALYYILKIWLSVLVALIISGIPPLLNVLYTFWRKRRIDVLGCIFVAAYVISAVLSVITGNVRLTMLRDSAVTAVISFLFLVTLIPLRTKWFTVRPIVFLFSQQMLSEQPPAKWTDAEGNKHELERAEWIWQYNAFYRKISYMLCAAWGVLLMGEFIAKVLMIQSSMSIDDIILYGNIIVIVVVVCMTIVSIFLTRYLRKRIVREAKVWYKENDFTGRLPK